MICLLIQNLYKNIGLLMNSEILIFWYSRKYMKENHIDIMHLNEINSVFLDCDMEGKGFVPKNKFLIAVAD